MQLTCERREDGSHRDDHRGTEHHHDGEGEPPRAIQGLGADLGDDIRRRKEDANLGRHEQTRENRSCRVPLSEVPLEQAAVVVAPYQRAAPVEGLVDRDKTVALVSKPKQRLEVQRNRSSDLLGWGMLSAHFFCERWLAMRCVCVSTMTPAI